MIKKCISWLWDASSGIRLRIVISSVVGLIRVAAVFGFIWTGKQLVDIATHAVSGNLTTYGIAFILLIFGDIFLSSLVSRLESQTDIRLKNTLRHRLFSHLMQSCWAGREKFHSGDLLNRLEEDVRVVTDTLCNAFPSVIVTLVQLIAGFVFLCYLDRTLAWTLAAIMPLFLAAGKVYMNRMRRLTREIRDTDSRVQSVLQENLQHRTVIQTLEQSPAMISRLASLQTGLYAQVMRRTHFTVFSRTMVALGFGLGYVVAFLWSISQLHEGAITFGVMTAFLQLVGQVQRPTVELSRQIPSFIHATTSIERLMELEEIPAEEQGAPVRLEGTAGIRIENATFAYPGGQRNILENFSFDFLPGSRTAIIGETGVGKSTLIRMMLSLLRPQTGKVLLYNDRKEVEASALTRCNLVYVPQGNTLFSGTIRDNLLLGDPAATDQQIFQALYLAAAEFVRDLPDQLDTLCGEQGTGLSEGQAQRIAIARGLLRKGSILLLDEFSSSLDRETEIRLMERLASSGSGKTMIFITHREVVTEYCTQTLRL